MTGISASPRTPPTKPSARAHEAACRTPAGGRLWPLRDFCRLILAQAGLKPIVLERGTEVRQRTKDTWGLWRKNVLKPESNVQFGEGGAGTFSDGKLYSQIKDPKHYGRKVLQEFVKAGAPDEILYVSKPHIGTFRLTGVVATMREEIKALGGEVRFQQRVSDVLIEDGQLDRRGARQRRADSQPPGDPGVGPQLARHLPHAAQARACLWKPSRSRWAFVSNTRKG